ncbi:MAG: hypothetical protein OXJ53_17350 [Gammaproteobacteria bacterium]|nr:hypothetical protein [Gammaproteobacteria bacterium]
MLGGGGDLAAVPPRRSLIARILGNLALAVSAALAGWLIVTYLRASEWPLDPSGHVVGLDFMVFWSTGVLVEQGQLLQLFDAARLHTLQEGLFARELPVKPRIWTHPPPPCS